MGVIDSLIMSACVGLSGQSKDACVKGLQAGTQQTGIQQSVNKYANQQTKSIEQSTFSMVGKENAQFVGGVLWLTKSVVDRKAGIEIPNFGLCNSISTEINKNAGKLLFRWKF